MCNAILLQHLNFLQSFTGGETALQDSREVRARVPSDQNFGYGGSPSVGDCETGGQRKAKQCLLREASPVKHAPHMRVSLRRGRMSLESHTVKEVRRGKQPKPPTLRNFALLKLPTGKFFTIKNQKSKIKNGIS